MSSQQNSLPLPPLSQNATITTPNSGALHNVMGMAQGQNQNQNQIPNAEPQSSPTQESPSKTGALEQMRAYRACLNCRNRKSKCDLDLNNGRPPCRRCTREARECVLGESHRGGRRVRKKPKLEGEMGEGVSSSPASQVPAFQSPSMHLTQSLGNYSPIPQNTQQQFQPQYSNRPEQAYWQHHTPSTSVSDATNSVRTNITTPSNDHFRPRQESTISLLTSAKPGDRAIHDGIASADLQNPSDALEILAQVADRADDGDSATSDQQGHNGAKKHRPAPQPTPPNMEDYLHYKPAQKGLITPEIIYHLFSSYEEFFHPYFPIIPRDTFDRRRLPWLSRHEPHLFSAILTIASKDNEREHQVCYDHMQELISMILAGADANVEAVEAMLLLSQWVSHRPQASTAVGRGEEDRVAWMYIGTALRLAYFLGIDRTAFKSDAQEDPATFNRKRLVWSACYICDRQVSVRVGKGFWARGPGPLSGLRSDDFPTLKPLSPGGDNYAEIFQANLELTQIFSNVHDILYASKGHGWKEMLEGRYAKYLDDFRSSIRMWNDTWGSLPCSRRLKTSLMLTYTYLRLYVNAFAYQATISRALTFTKDSQHRPNRPIPLIDASAPDARFIYEALDAAQSLLTTFNTLVDPETLRYMPSSYYLYIIYSAVFLYKARSTTTMSEEERNTVRQMISQTIDRLQNASMGSNHMGTRYARLLQLLWRKAPRRSSVQPPQIQSLDGRLMPQPQVNNGVQFDPQQQQQFALPGMNQNYLAPSQNPSHNTNTNQNQNAGAGTFSWLDLPAAWDFATQNNSGSVGEVDDSLIDPGLSPWGMDVNLTDYAALDGDNPGFIF